MFCPKCGIELPDESKVCGSCGAVFAEEATQPETAQPETTQPEEAQPAAEAPAPTPVPFTDAAPEAPKSTGFSIGSLNLPFSPKKLIAIVAAVAVLIGAVFGAVALFSSGGEKPAYVYLSDETYMLLPGLNKDAIEIAPTKADDDSTYTSSAFFSEDGKYLYYFTKLEDNCGTLNRVELAKLGKNASKNEKHLESIGSDVSIHSTVLVGDNGVAYRNSKGNLYYYNGKEPVQIDKDVVSIYPCGDKHLLYTVMDEEDDDAEAAELWGVELKKLDEPVRLGKDVDSVIMSENPNEILFLKDTSEKDDDGYTDYSHALYKVAFGKEEEKLGDDVSNLHYEYNDDGDRVAYYFMAENGTSLNLYDYVTDEKKDADKDVKEPNYDDFSTPNYYYSMISDYAPTESRYTELYTSCTEELYLLGESYYWSYSMEDALDETWGTNTTKLHAAIQSFIDTYADQANEDGMIKVTDDVKAALKKIHAASSRSTKTNHWLWLCYDRYQSGYTTDYDAYYAAQDAYYEASNRNSLREQLKDEDNNVSAYNVYCYKDGKVTTVLENVLDTDTNYGVMLYNTMDSVAAEKSDLSELDGMYDVSKIFALDPEAENNVYLFETGKTVKMSGSAAEEYAEILEETEYNYAPLYYCNNAIYVEGADNELFAAKIEDGVIGSFDTFAEDAQLMDVVDDVVYYVKDIHDRDDVEYGDLVALKGDKETTLASDINCSGAYLYEDGMLLAATDTSDDGAEVALFNKKGEGTVIGEEITSFYRMDAKTFLYISDGDLYSFKKDKSERVATDVDRLWVFGDMDYEYLG